MNRSRLLFGLIVLLLVSAQSYADTPASQSTGDEERLAEAVREADSLYNRMVAILKNVDIPERYDAVEDTLRVLWRHIVELETRYPDLDPSLLNDALFSNEDFILATERFEIELERIYDAMPSRGDRLQIMIEEIVEAADPDAYEGTFTREREDTRFAEPTEEEILALREYEKMLGWALELFTKLQTVDDIDRHRDDLLSLGKREARVRMSLPGSRGEYLIENDPELVKLLQSFGAEQMRIMEDEELSAKLRLLFEESGS